MPWSTCSPRLAAGVLVGTTCLLQFAVSLVHRPRATSTGLGRSYFWMIWYPIAFWVLGFLTVIAATPSVLLGRDRGRAVWVSPDRGAA